MLGVGSSVAGLGEAWKGVWWGGGKLVATLNNNSMSGLLQGVPSRVRRALARRLRPSGLPRWPPPLTRRQPAKGGAPQGGCSACVCTFAAADG